ncbi:hypothetical protein SETIT_6G229700v2 [Setaria italica]|uniref:NB-ARC domain-containing protein n=2 Tax=Setaria italica TaxID=4555 RepID=A0A368RPQ7_SETIT|nr:putative disease resistance RPP13-like protein 3 [Setaria italica]XP_012702478.1 putative disease resistance RPP13-like protein 3 [Setaria italica]RCV32086.1 hypothetical protein SETIT_6G229700v2 [Setaria italica]RCV32087.1 hypothetical protein SETIT_6G229700v2 [Setaria italica]RCV32088.1 hypothetical protein SETIT_6G229700v2 [Setaria italica]
MEATGLSLGKSVLDGALGYAKSAAAEEVALQLGIQRDHAFIRDELAMMQAFLRAAHGERYDHEVLMTWVKQVRDVAYDAEDCLQDFSIHLKKPSWWRLPSTLLERHRIAKQMKELRARVEDVSQRNLRYQLIKRGGSKPDTTAGLSSNKAAAIFGIDEARRAAKHDKPKEDLVDLINQEGKDLRVIAVWGTSGDLGQTTIVNMAYENPVIKKKFPCRAWVRVFHPFNLNDFVQSLVKQFRSAMGIDVLLETEKTGKELAKEFTRYINENSYLIVLNDMSTFEEWNGIKACLPNHKKGSRIIVCSPQVEVASLCAGQESQALELKQLSIDQTIYAFYEKDCQDQIKSPVAVSSIDKARSGTNVIVGNQSQGGDERKVFTKSLTHIKTMVSALEESQLIGRQKEKADIIQLISNPSSQGLSVISVWGMGGLGKTALVKDVYESQKQVGIFEKHACVTVMRPFILKEFLENLIMQLNAQSSGKKGAIDVGHGTRNTVAMMRVEALIKELARLLEGKKCLIVLDDLSSIAEWDNILGSFPKLDSSFRILVTTREESIAKYCSEKLENIYKLKVLEYKDAQDLFTRKVFKEAKDLDKHPELIKEAKMILKKCNGLPLAIVTIGGFLAKQPKVAVEWRKLNEHISAELEMNPELGAIKTILGKSYDGLPYHLKSCFLYTSIFPEDHKVSRRRLIQRWSAEGYSREIRDKSLEEVADNYFMELIERSMILPSQLSVNSRKGIDSCQVHDLMREISISKSTEENLVFRMEEGCSSNTQGTVRHLVISTNWKADKSEFENKVDLSRIRSLTVFGKWRSFFISDKMRFLRVLDLEGTSGLVSHHLKHIGKLLHLRYLSLRECKGIFHLSDSLGNLKQLKTLDISGTLILKLPKTITKLKKLQYLRAGTVGKDDDSLKVFFEELPKVVNNRPCFCMGWLLGFCVACCALQLFKEATDGDDDMNRCDVFTQCCCVMLPFLMVKEGATWMPRGMGKLKSLRTLGLVNLDKAILRDIKGLTQLRKLAVTGINKENSQELCSVVANLSCLESLLVQACGMPGLHGCLDGLTSAPKNLQSLKIYGNLLKLPGWVEELKNLVKLVLRSSRILEHEPALQVLGKLPNLVSLRLWAKSFQVDDLRFTFHPEAFPSLIVLELNDIDGLKSVEFEEGAMLRLERLDFCGKLEETNTGMFSGLPLLRSLKEFMLDSKTYEHAFMEDLQGQLGANPNGPALKMW